KRDAHTRIPQAFCYLQPGLGLRKMRTLNVRPMLSAFVVVVALLTLHNEANAQTKGFSIVENKAEKRIDILLDGKLFTSYIYPDDIKKPALYPLLTADGAPVTRGWPLNPRPGERVDHPHHVGMWFNYGDVNGLDFWNNSPNIPEEKRGRYGTVKHRSVNKTS